MFEGKQADPRAQAITENAGLNKIPKLPMLIKETRTGNLAKVQEHDNRWRLPSQHCSVSGISGNTAIAPRKKHEGCHHPAWRRLASHVLPKMLAGNFVLDGMGRAALGVDDELGDALRPSAPNSRNYVDNQNNGNSRQE